MATRPIRKSTPRKRNSKRNQAARTQYVPKNPGKYKGTYPIWLRSRWEIKFAQFCDANPSIIEWASEPISIPYKCPLTLKQKVYVPDFLIKAVRQTSRKGRLIRVIQTVLIEIKPAHETFIKEARNQRDAAQVMKNAAKWAAASAWCRRRGIKLQILTEKDLFKQPAANTAKTGKKTVVTKRVASKGPVRRPGVRKITRKKR